MRFIGLVKVTSESVSCLDFAGGVPPLGSSCFVFLCEGSWYTIVCDCGHLRFEALPRCRGDTKTQM
jgi:hypothetical protein